jgi:nitrite reductase/ring-hydroxylating ferredoxin subunit/uncharacterized membrane protein
MRSSAHLKGHPLHPMLVGFPIAYLFGGACIDVLAQVSHRSSWSRTARHMNALGLGSALVAAAPGLVDYVFAVPPESTAKKRATRHLLTNLSALALFAIARAGRRADDARPSPWAVAAEVCGTGLMAAAGWMGGTLVYRNQIAVDHRYAGAGKWRVDVIVPPEGADSVDVGAVSELEVNQMKLLRIGSRRIVVARTEKGYAAFDDHCTHRGGPLADGTLACGTVQCPWHGSQFNVETGAVTHGPAKDPIQIYPVSPRDGRLILQLPADHSRVHVGRIESGASRAFNSRS